MIGFRKQNTDGRFSDKELSDLADSRVKTLMNDKNRGMEFIDKYQNKKPLDIVGGLKSEGALSDTLADGISSIINKMESNGFNIDIKFKDSARFIDDAFDRMPKTAEGILGRVRNIDANTNLQGDLKKTQYLRIKDKPSHAMETISHELMHSITNVSIDYAKKFPKSKEGIALKRISDMQKILERKMMNKYESAGSTGSKMLDAEILSFKNNGKYRDIGIFGNEKEFISYATTNPEVIRILKDITYKKGNSKATMLNKIRDYIFSMFGLEKKYQQEFTTFYDKISKSSIKLSEMTDYSKLDNIVKYTQ